MNVQLALTFAFPLPDVSPTLGVYLTIFVYTPVRPI